MSLNHSRSERSLARAFRVKPIKADGTLIQSRQVTPTKVASVADEVFEGHNVKFRLFTLDGDELDVATVAPAQTVFLCPENLNPPSQS
jgi:hypothetical protein